MMVKLTVLIALAARLVTAATAVASAETAAERAACKPDLFRLCTAGQIALAVIGDRSGVYACFTQHRRELSRPCDRVLKHHGY